MTRRTGRFNIGDIAQQIVGGFLLSGPFVVTEEVWKLAANMSTLQVVFTLFVVFSIGYGALYKADEGRDPDKEADLGGIPLRFISLMFVTYLSVLILVFTFSAQKTFSASIEVTFRVVCIASIFSVIGAAGADSIF